MHSLICMKQTGRQDDAAHQSTCHLQCRRDVTANYILRLGRFWRLRVTKACFKSPTVKGGQNVTVMACCNAVGNFIPAMVIFKGVRCKPEFADGAPPETLIEMSECGYISADLFLFWLKHFQHYRAPGKCILVHVKSLEVLDYAKENDITLICLPPHTTHYLQPLNRSFFNPLKVYYDQACRSFISNHPGQSITKLQFSTLLNQAWGKAATVEIATNGFQICGLHPINRLAISKHAYAPPSGVSEISVPFGNRQATASATQSLPLDISSATAHQQSNQLVSAVNTEETEEVISSTANNQNDTGARDPGPSTETEISGLHSLEGPVGDTGAISPTGDSGAVGSPAPRDPCEPCSSDDATSPDKLSFRDLHPTPKVSRTIKTGDGRRQSAAALTSPSSSNRKTLFDKTTAKCSQIPKKTKQTCRENKKRGRIPR